MTRRAVSLRAVVLVSLAASAALVLSACSSGGADGIASAPASAASDGSSPGPAIEAGSGVTHIHNLSLDGDRLLLGTHEGLWQQVAGEEPSALSSDPFDVMGFALGSDRWLASGHPGEGMDAPSDLGLLESRNGGVDWEVVSLSGEVDFHRLVTSGDTVLGLSAHDGMLLRSADAGQTWTDLGTPPLYDLAVSPADPALVVGTSEAGPVASSDGGATFTPVEGAPLIALLAWDPAALYGVGVDGTVFVSDDSGATWTALGSAGGQPAAVAAGGSRIVVLTEGTVVESTDGGRTFAPRLTGLEGH